MPKKQSVRSRAKILLLFLACVVFYNEYLSYTLQAWLKWPSLACEKCVRILLVADPQIIGERYELLGPLARWDCDRYLSKTFQKAIAHAQPDVVAFLGDIMDEGSIATKDEYARYLYRFFKIFHAAPDIKMLYLPGDNDIGGEDDRITSQKLTRYEQSFRQPDTLKIRNVDLFKVNRLTYSIPHIQDNHTHYLGNRTHIVLTHLPLLFLPNQYVHKVVKQLRPQVIFSAHDHKSLHTSINAALSEDEQFVEMLLPSSGPTWQFQLKMGLVHELMVPTCSYRMGVPNMGYGMAVIDTNSENMTYAVLWLPSRFVQLGIYVGMLLVIYLYLVFLGMCRVYSKIRNKCCRRSKVSHRV